MEEKLRAPLEIPNTFRKTKFLTGHEHNWKKLGNFERKYKEMFLKRLTKNEGLEMLNNLYKFVQEIGHRKDYKKLDLQKIQILSKVHSIFMKVNP